MAQQISNCEETRERGGEIGWISTNDDDGSKNEHLDLVFPRQAREAAARDIVLGLGDSLESGDDDGASVDGAGSDPLKDVSDSLDSLLAN